MTRADVGRRLQELGREAELRFSEALEKIGTRAAEIDSVLLLASLARYSLTGVEGHGPNEWASGQAALQPHVEILQALLLRARRQGARPPMNADIPEVAELLRTLGDAFYLKRLATIDPEAPREAVHRAAVLEGLRTQTQAIRNWAYPQQTRSMVVDLFAPFDDRIQEKLGVRIASLVQLWFALIGVVEERLNSHMARLRPGILAKTPEEAITAYVAANPQITEGSDALMELVREQGATLEQVQAMLFLHADLNLEDVYTITLDDGVAAYPAPVDHANLRRALDAWSLEFGALGGDNPEHFFMANPIWRTPLIKTGEDQYFCPIVGIGISFCLELMEELVRHDEDLRIRYEDRRANYLEDKVAELFRRGVPGAALHEGVLWSDPADASVLYENDLVLVVDSLLFVAESKSGRLTAPARRGAEKSVGSNVQELLITPARQARRFAHFLRTHPGVHEFKTKRGETVSIDTSQLADVASISVTLDQLGTLGARWTELRDAGLIEHGEELAPTIALPDLEIIFDVLERPADRLHYLIRRAEFERRADYVGDELDLLAFYLDRGFSIGSMEFDGTHLRLWGMSRDLDPYFMQEWNAPKSAKPVKKPGRRLTRWWRDILDRLEKVRPSGWLTMSMRLLDVAREDQENFERIFRAAAKRLKKNWVRLPNGLTSTVRFGGQERPSAIVGLTFRHVKPPRHRELLHVAIERAANEFDTDRVLGIGVDIMRDDYPYGIIACPNLDGLGAGAM